MAKYNIGDLLERKSTRSLYEVMSCDGQDYKLLICQTTYKFPVHIVENSSFWSLHQAAPRVTITSTVATNPVVSQAAQMMAELVQALKDGEYDIKVTNMTDYPHKCPKCGSSAYIGFSKIDCSNGSCGDGIR